MTRNLIFIGANNPETLAMVEALGPSGDFRFLGFVDNDPAKKNTQYCGLPVLGGFDVLCSISSDEVSMVNLISRDAETRFETSKLVADMGFSFANFIHPSVELTGVTLGTGNYIQRNVTLQVDVRIGHNSCINSGCVVAHETSIGSSTFLAPGAVLAGLVKIGDGVLIGTGATVLPRVSVGDWSVVGAGAVIVDQVPRHEVHAGVPGRKLRDKPSRHSSGKPWNDHA